MTKKTTPKNEQPTNEIIFVVNPDDVSVGDLMDLEEATTVKEQMEFLARFVTSGDHQPDDVDAAILLIRSMTLRQLMEQRASLIKQFRDFQGDFIPN